MRTLHRSCAVHQVKGWRKARYWTEKVHEAFLQVRTARRCRNVDQVEAYLKLCRTRVERAQGTLKQLLPDTKIASYLAHAVRQIDQVARRWIQKEVIPEGVFGP